MVPKRGFTLIEILISLLLLSLIIHLWGKLTNMMQRQAQSAYFYAQASSQLSWIAEVITKRGEVSKPLLQQWQQQNELLLPKGKGILHANKIEIFWGVDKPHRCTVQKIDLQGCFFYEMQY